MLRVRHYKLINKEIKIVNITDVHSDVAKLTKEDKQQFASLFKKYISTYKASDKFRI